jgi:hypothetical protein
MTFGGDVGGSEGHSTCPITVNQALADQKSIPSGDRMSDGDILNL